MPGEITEASEMPYYEWWSQVCWMVSVTTDAGVYGRVMNALMVELKFVCSGCVILCGEAMHMREL